MLNLLKRKSKHICTAPKTNMRRLLERQAKVTIFLTDTTAITGNLVEYVRDGQGKLTEVTVANQRLQTTTTVNWDNTMTITEYNNG